LNGYLPVKKNCITYWSVFDIESKRSQLIDLQLQIENPGFWNDPETAQRVMKHLSFLNGELQEWQDLSTRLADTLELVKMMDDDLRIELEAETSKIENEISHLEFEAKFSGKYDRGDALLAIHSGAGGTDSQDWAEMLQRMYLRWAEARNYRTEILDLTEGEEAGIKSTTIAVNGRFAYGYLRSEKGVHRLVRLSPFDSAHRRHTSFALIEVLPQVEEDAEVSIDPEDLRVDVYRSSSAGGQNVQKNATAIRITHLPTGIVVTCQNERSQTQNRENAMRVLRSRLVELKQREQEEKIAELRGEYQKAEWGNQIRSYVLHPYQLVKDHRTGYESGNTQSVLNGDIEDFIDAYLRATVGEKSTA
jgi:peptide chain release factor 2